MTLHAETAGHGPQLLFIHGWGMHGGFWNACAQDLRHNFTTTLLDLPGHGYSPYASKAFSLAALTSGAARLIRERTTLIGWSLGGMIALELARRFPHQVARLILVGGTPRFRAAPDWSHAMSEDSFASFAKLVERDSRRALQRFLALQAHGSLDPRGATRRLQTLLASRPTARSPALRESLALLRDTDLRPTLAHVGCPTLLIHGKRDAIIPCQAAETCGRQLPDTRIRLFDGAGHAPFLTHHHEFVHAVRAFCHEH